MRTTTIDFFRREASAQALVPNRTWRSPQPRRAPACSAFDIRKRAVLRLAACIEDDVSELERWFSHDALVAFQDRTAEQVVADGENQALMVYLLDIICQDNDIQWGV